MLEKNRHYLQQLLDWSRAEGHPLYVVGGTLRDRALGRDCSDIDLASAIAPQLAERFAAKYDLPRVPLDTTPGREMIRVVLENEVYLDFATLQGNSIEEDLDSRDFTINAMGQTLEDFLAGSDEVIDPHYGIDDIQSQTVRLVKESALEDDPLRMLRAFRFANSLNFKLEPDTLSSIAQHASKIEKVAGERIHYELLLILRAPDSNLQPMQDTGLVRILVPELAEPNVPTVQALERFLKDPESSFPGFGERISQFLKARRRTALIKMAALLLPVAENNSSQFVSDIFKRLRFSNSDIHFMVHTLTLFQNLQEEDFQKGESSPSSLYRLAKLGEEMVVSASVLALAVNAKSKNPDSNLEVSLNRVVDFYYNRYLPAQEHPVLLNGTDLQKAFHLKPSSRFKTILDRIEEARVLGNITTPEQAKEMAQQLIESL